VKSEITADSETPVVENAKITWLLLAVTTEGLGWHWVGHFSSFAQMALENSLAM